MRGWLTAKLPALWRCRVAKTRRWQEACGTGRGDFVDGQPSCACGWRCAAVHGQPSRICGQRGGSVDGLSQGGCVHGQLSYTCGRRRGFMHGWGAKKRPLQNGKRLRVAPAFTLLETLMVLLVGGMLLVAASSFLFGALALRRQIEEAPQLGQHAASVARLLETLIASAQPQQGATAGGQGAGGTAVNTTPGGTDAAAAGSQVNWQELPSVVFGSGQALYLKARAGLPIFVGESGLNESGVSCYLLLEQRDGLVLFWQSERMRQDDENHWERTVLSPLVVGANLLFYDAEREQWERSEGLKQPFTNPERLPQLIELTFREPGNSREIMAEVLLPPQSTQLLGL